MPSLKDLIRTTPLLGQAAAWLRYRNFKRRVRQADRAEGPRPVDAAGIAIPPAELRFRVHGDLSSRAFVNVGRQVAGNIRRCLERVDGDWSSFTDILDFGCGSARVIRWFLAEGGQQHFTGADINRELIDWCRAHIAGVDWVVTPPEPPAPLAGNSFDLIYGISVFTHLDHDLQQLWLAELDRLIRPGGIVLLTVHGAAYAAHIKLAGERARQLDDHGFLYLKGVTGKWKLDGLPDFYQTAIQTPTQVQRHWGGRFDILGHFEGAVNNLQDAVLLRSRKG